MLATGNFRPELVVITGGLTPAPPPAPVNMGTAATQAPAAATPTQPPLKQQRQYNTAYQNP